jgi:DNA-binding IclR family transcriptional regulator
MQDESKQFPDGEPATERIVVLQLLRNDRSEWWSRAEVLRKLRDINPDAVRGSLAHLERLGLLDRNGARFKASDGLRYIDVVLDLICL